LILVAMFIVYVVGDVGAAVVGIGCVLDVVAMLLVFRL